jgi:hypothetical protein
MDIQGIVSIVVFLIMVAAVFIISFYVYIYFSHEYEINFKGIRFIIVSIILTIFCTFFNLLLVTFDYINAKFQNVDEDIEGDDQLLDIKDVWMINLAFSSFIFTNNIFWLVYYRYYNPINLDKFDYEIPKRVKLGAISVAKMLFTIFILIIPMTFFGGGRVKISIPVQVYSPMDLTFSSNQQDTDFSTQVSRKEYIDMFPSPIIMLAAPFILYGSFIFYVIGAFGLAAVPANFFTLWFRRPKKPDADDMVMCDMVLTEETVENIEKLKDLVEIEEEIDEMKQDPDHDKEALEKRIETFEKEVRMVQKKLIIYEDMRATKNRQHNFLEENPLKYFFSLIMAILCSILSVMVVLHNFFSIFQKYTILEGMFNFLKSINTVYLQLGYLVIAFYLLFCCIKGYEKISYLFPNQIGFNQMQPNRTWIDTWLIMCNLLIPSSWAVVSFFIRLCPNIFNEMYGARIIRTFILKIHYLKIFYDYEIFVGLLLFSFIMGIIINFSAGMTTEELNKRVFDTRENMKGNQMKYQMDMRGFRA